MFLDTNLQKKEIIIEEGTLGEFIYFILNGVVKVFSVDTESESKDVKFKRFYCMGDYFGESVLDMTAGNTNRRKANVTAKTDVTVLSVHRS